MVSAKALLSSSLGAAAMQQEHELGKAQARWQQARQTLQAKGRLTLPRQQVLALLLAAEHALSHADLELAAVASGYPLDRVTLYRVLDYLVQQQIAHKIAGEDRIWRFSASRGLDHGHAHFYCLGCGQVFCVDAAIQPSVVNLAPGYQLATIDILLRGHCARCAAAT